MAALVALLLWFGSIVFAWFVSLDSDSRSPILALIGVISVPIVAYFTQRSLERRRSLETSIREHKTKLYDDMIRGMLGMLGLGNQPAMGGDEMLEFFGRITPPLMTYGSRGVIKAWTDMRAVAVKNSNTDGGGDPYELVWSLEGILKAMRKDLGHQVRLQPEGELLRVFINDVDDMIARKKGAKGRLS